MMIIINVCGTFQPYYFYSKTGSGWFGQKHFIQAIFVKARYFLGTVRAWHWVSSAVCLVGLILFSVTGITLNHAGSIGSEAQVSTLEVDLSQGMLSQLQNRVEGPLPFSVRKWLLSEHDVHIPDTQAEWDEYEVYLGLPKPGGDAWLSVDLDSGLLIYEETSRGLIAYFNDLHKGRHTGLAWSWFIDAFSVLCLVFSLSGLWLLARYAKQRPSTWPLVIFGIIAPFILILLSVH